MDAWGVRRRNVQHRGGAYDEILEHPLANIEDPAEFDRYSWPQREWWDAEGLANEIRQLDAQGDYAIALEEFGDPGGIFEIAWYLIKAEFGDKLCFHGGLDLQTTLPRGTENEVRRVTRERIDVLGRKGGYILSPTHSVQVDTPRRTPSHYMSRPTV